MTLCRQHGASGNELDLKSCKGKALVMSLQSCAMSDGLSPWLGGLNQMPITSPWATKSCPCWL